MKQLEPPLRWRQTRLLWVKSWYRIVSVLLLSAPLQGVLLLLLLRLLLYHGVLLIQQLPDLIVVVTQAAFQADASGLRPADGHHVVAH